MENVYLIAGLGNSGAGYECTRHNAGFMVVERVARRWQAGWALDDRFKSCLARIERDGRKMMLCQPQTFMNASGEAVRILTEYFRVPLARCLVVVDDADLPLGEIRLRPRGSSGGHHGLESIEQQLATREFARQRIGIGRTAGGGREITGHVLGRFSLEEAGALEMVLDRAADQIECWVNDGIEPAMNRFNGTVGGCGNEKKTE